MQDITKSGRPATASDHDLPLDTDATAVDAALLPPPPTLLADQRRTQSAPDAVPVDPKVRLEDASPLQSSTQSIPKLPTTRKSLSDARPDEKGRHSEQFDRRYDGPFGRPSLVMGRRPSIALSVIPEPERTHVMDDNEAVTDRGTVPFQPRPPPLNYTLRTRKAAIFYFWSITVFDTVVCPLVLYFGLWYGVGPGNPDNQKLSANTVFSIVTAAIGGAAIFEYFLRGWRLWRKNSTCRAIGATEQRWLFDWFHWWYTAAWVIVMIELIIGSVQEDPFIRLLAMPLATMLYVFGTLLLVIDVCRYFHVPAPVRLSSVPRGSQLRPGIYPLIEDICAVDGSGGTDFRIALDKRYEASHVFRTMLRRLGIFWAVGSEGCAVMMTILIFSLNNTDIAYAIGWGVPFVWAGIWAAATTWYVSRELKKEETLWKEKISKTQMETA
ncbi:Uu.00g005940.m01.CDS01 [Anthostomella pinea]|uniref:Uu.00g005940.m01.CDS01 n=1 Tax=Anthostomella pinea TaxID=933095 RepID=A0AAI8YGJ2_9PEZI|nr:Uu.00g005940.m01.CDS01 [Anthostomella pinea]